MFIAALNTNDRVFHYHDCIYAQKIKPSNAIYFENKDQPRACGYRCCIHCSRLNAFYDLNKEAIDNFIKEHKLEMYLYDDSMFIENGPAAWKIATEPKGPGLLLYHANTENYSKLKTMDGRILHSYHFQKYHGRRDIMSMLEFIVEHDKWKADNMESYKDMPKNTNKQKRAYRKAKKESLKAQAKNTRNLIEKLRIEREEKENGVGN